MGPLNNAKIAIRVHIQINPILLLVIDASWKMTYDAGIGISLSFRLNLNVYLQATIQGTLSALQGELFALLVALNLIKAYGAKKISIFSDCKQMVQNVNASAGSCIYLWRMHNLLWDVKKLLIELEAKLSIHSSS